MSSVCKVLSGMGDYLGRAGRFLLVVFTHASLIFGAAQINAKQPTNRSFMAVDVGAYVSNIDDRFTAPDGFAEFVSQISGILRFRPGFHLGNRFYFEPSVAMLIPWRSGADGGTKTFTFQLDLDASIPVFSFLQFRAGPGIQWQLMVSTQQAITLNNGSSSQTTTFYTPGGTVSVFVATVQGGFEFKFSDHISLNLETYVLDIADNLRRRFNGAISLGFVL